jgi:hypothetical protein
MPSCAVSDVSQGWQVRLYARGGPAIDQKHESVAGLEIGLVRRLFCKRGQDWLQLSSSLSVLGPRSTSDRNAKENRSLAGPGDQRVSSETREQAVQWEGDREDQASGTSRLQYDNHCGPGQEGGAARGPGR